jgi:hypothetical protein
MHGAGHSDSSTLASTLVECTLSPWNRGQGLLWREKCSGPPLVLVCSSGHASRPHPVTCRYSVFRPMSNVYCREVMRRRISLGKCAACAGTPLVTKVLCGRCRELCRASMQRRRERLKAEGMCAGCGRAIAPSNARCEQCKEESRVRMRERRRNGRAAPTK